MDFFTLLLFSFLFHLYSLLHFEFLEGGISPEESTETPKGKDADSEASAKSDTDSTDGAKKDDKTTSKKASKKEDSKSKSKKGKKAEKKVKKDNILRRFLTGLYVVIKNIPWKTICLFIYFIYFIMLIE